ncbi:MAG: sugar phosphate isomerase/epimerase [Rhodospirillaceae bacterium]|nr:sugar phosphate isomerase/epimerase [Rhodospirillaceae bacterium]
MLLSVSNIAWTQGDDPALLNLLRANGYAGLDVAPTKIWPDWQADSAATARFARQVTDAGLRTIGMQSIFFGTTSLNIFADGERWLATKRHLRRVAGIAKNIGATRIVFGAPANRDPGNLAAAAAAEIALRRLRRLGGIFADAGTRLCLEPVPADAGGRFLLTTLETATFVRLVDHPGICLNLDSAFLAGEGEPIERTIQSCADVIGHAHASEPALGTFAPSRVDHRAMGVALRKIGYTGAVAIEMRAITGAEERNLRDAMKVVSACYGVA